METGCEVWCEAWRLHALAFMNLTQWNRVGGLRPDVVSDYLHHETSCRRLLEEWDAMTPSRQEDLEHWMVDHRLPFPSHVRKMLISA